MTTARAAARQLLTELTEGPLRSFTATGGSATTVVSATLARWAEDSDAFPYWYLGMTKVAGSATWESRPIKRTSGYVASTTTATVTDAYGGNIANADTGELHRYDPDFKHVCLNRAIEELYRRGLYLPLLDQSLAVDSLLQNGGLETFSTTFTNWTNIGTPTLAAETTRKVQGLQSGSITASGATEGIEQNVITRVNLREVVSKTLYVDGFIWASVEDAARFRVTFDGSTYTNGAWHKGNAEWEGSPTVGISVAVPADATEFTISCEVTDGNTAYFDGITAYVNPIYQYTLPSTFVDDPYHVLQQVNKDDPHSMYLPIGHRNRPKSGHWLQLVGKGRLTQYGTAAGDEADTTEADGEQIMLIALKAAAIMFRSLSGFPTSEDSGFYAEQAAIFDAKAEAMIAQDGILPYPMSAQERKGVWDVEKAGTTNLLVLKQGRG